MYEFIMEPSLISQNQRQKEQLLAYARSHASAYASKHVKGRIDDGKATNLLLTNENELPSLSISISDNDSHQNTFVERLKCILRKQDEQAKRNLLILPSTIRPVISTYIESTYLGNAASHVSRLFEYFLLILGPLCIWRHYEAEYERDAFRLHIIDCFLNEPGYTETMLARLQHLHDQLSADSTHVSTSVYHHRTKSLLLLRKKLVEKDSKSRYSTVTIIVAQIILCLQLGDWDGYKIHLKGLSQLLHIPSDVGLPICLDQRNLRTVSELFVVQEAQAKCRTPDDSPDAAMGRLDLALSASTVTIDIQRNYSAKLPTGLYALYKSTQIRSSILAPMYATIKYLALCYNISRGLDEDSSYSAATEDKLATTFIDILQYSDLTHAEMFLSTGMLILISTMPPDSRAQWQYPLDIVMVRAVMNISKSYMLIRQPQHYVLWTALVMAGVPRDYMLPARDRWTILRMVLNDSKQCLPWSQVEVLLSRFYLDGTFAPLWKHCYLVGVESSKGTYLQ